ncbi:hypothetical protein TKK_0007925 [Trichogramma kaykai]
MIIQDMWSRGLNWDENVPELLHRQWTEFREGLSDLHQFVIPRWIGSSVTTRFRGCQSPGDSCRRLL